jgi:signal transduction histidine kinase/HAMP domain-containing protein
MRTLTVQWRVMVRLLPLLVLLFVGVLAWLGAHLTRLLYASAAELAKRSNMAVVTAIQASMASEGGHRDWRRVPDEITRGKSTEVDVVDTRGKVVYSSRRALVGRTISKSDPVCARCHTGDGRKATTEAKFLKAPDESGFQVFAAPLNNTTACRRCHTREGPKIGVVLVRQPLEPIARQVRTVQVALAIAGIVSLLLTLLAARVLLGRFVDRPLKTLVSGARAIGAGKLDEPIELRDRTELSLLAAALNTAARRLKGMIGQLGRQRDDFESLYRLVDQLSRSITPEERRRRCVALASEILGAPCLLVRAGSSSGVGTEALRITYQSDQDTIIDREGLPDPEVDPPLVVSSLDVIERWLQGKLDDETEVEHDGGVAYPLSRQGQVLGLLVSGPPQGEPRSDDTRPSVTPDMIRALSKHLAIALEYSALQQDLIARERLAAIGETVAGLAHCLKNTLNGLRAGQYVVDRASETGDQKRLRDGWRVMKNAVRQVERLTLDMLYYVKDRPPRREPVDPNEILEEVVGVLEEMAAAQKVELRTDLDRTIGQVPLDRTAIYRAILDLASNAVDACTESEHGDRVVLRSRRTDTHLTLSVEDNGVGIPEEIRIRLFTRFFSTKAGKGTGLGLSVVKKIAEEHGGSVEVVSQPGQGSTFHCYLPLRQEASRPPLRTFLTSGHPAP